MNWFVVNESEDIGPLSKFELDAYVKSSGQSEDSILIKNEVMAKAMPYSSIFTRFVGDDLPTIPDFVEESLEEVVSPELSLPVDEGLSFADEEEIVEHGEDKYEDSLEVTGPEVDDVVSVSTDSASTFTEEDMSELSDLQSPSRANKILLFGIIALFVLSCGGYFYFKNLVPDFSRPSKMSVKNFGLVKKTLQSDLLTSSFISAIDNNAFWFVTSNMGEGRLRVEMTSQPKENLADKEVVIQGSAILKDGVAYFDNFAISSGTKVIDGYYDVKINSVTNIEKKMKFFLRPYEDSISFEQRRLISLGDEMSFNDKLKKTREEKYKNSIEFQTELLQKYLTLKTITAQIKEALLGAFAESELKWIKRVEKFKVDYMNKHGQFFTSFIIENEKQYKEISQKEFPDKIKIISDYTKLSRLAKETGYKSAETIEELEKFGFEKATMEEILLLKQTRVSGFDDVIAAADERIEFIKSYLSDKE